MLSKTMRSNLLLLSAAIIWGFAFVAQRVGAQQIGSFTFNGIRFAIGSISLIPLILFLEKKEETNQQQSLIDTVKSSILPGIVLFIAASLQQIGLAYTTASKAAFITGLYIIIVPFLGIFLKHTIQKVTWIGATLSLLGLYFLTMAGPVTISYGDLFEIIGAFFWASHILLIDYFTKKTNPLILSSFQFATCSFLSLIVAIVIEPISISYILKAIIPILYGGFCSVGIAYTLQVVGQQHAQPTHAAIILSMEVLFGAIGGWLILHESLGVQELLGGILMLSGMLISQLPQSIFLKKRKPNLSDKTS